MTKFPAGHNWLVSYPKSGSTWVRLLFANLMFGREEPVYINDLTNLFDCATSRQRFEEQSLSDSSLLTVAQIDRLRPLVWANDLIGCDAEWIRVHDTFASIICPNVARSSSTRAIYIVRDPRDVAISFSHYFGVSIDHAIAMLGDTDSRLRASRFDVHAYLGRWSDHVLGWIDQTAIPVHLVRYEDLKTDCVRTFATMVDFFGGRFATAEIERAVENADFRKLRQQEDLHGYIGQHPDRGPFFRSGRSGDWRTNLDLAQVARIEAAHSDVMRRLGYDLSTDTRGEGDARPVT